MPIPKPNPNYFINMPKILITGGTGYIGSHTAVELQQAGFEVVIVDNLSNSKIEVLDGIEKITGKRPEFFEFDLCDQKKVDKFFKKNKFDAVIHFAALKAVGESVSKPLMYYRNNLVSTLNVLDAMVKNQVNNFIFSSSATVYGEPDKLPIAEDAPLKAPANPYGATKQINERIIIDSAKANQSFQSIILRYFNPIGAHPSSLIGELPFGAPNNLAPFITQTGIGLRDKLKVFGADYNTPDGTGIRDYLHVVDLARAHVVAAKRLLDKKNKLQVEVFNLGTGTGTSVLEMIKYFEKVSGQKLNYEIVGRRPGDIDSCYCDPTLADQILGWRAELTIEDAMKDAWNWQKSLTK
jgi:UDP-glucose 4-epimerase